MPIRQQRQEPDRTIDVSIPKILHFTWKTKTLPGFLNRLFEGWKALHPDWEVMLWDDADIDRLVREDYPDLVPVFERFPHQIFRVDSFRFLRCISMAASIPIST